MIAVAKRFCKRHAFFFEYRTIYEADLRRRIERIVFRNRPPWKARTRNTLHDSYASRQARLLEKSINPSRLGRLQMNTIRDKFFLSKLDTCDSSSLVYPFGRHLRSRYVNLAFVVGFRAAAVSWPTAALPLYSSLFTHSLSALVGRARTRPFDMQHVLCFDSLWRVPHRCFGRCLLNSLCVQSVCFFAITFAFRSRLIRQLVLTSSTRF